VTDPAVAVRAQVDYELFELVPMGMLGLLGGLLGASFNAASASLITLRTQLLPPGGRFRVGEAVAVAFITSVVRAPESPCVTSEASSAPWSSTTSLQRCQLGKSSQSSQSSQSSPSSQSSSAAGELWGAAGGGLRAVPDGQCGGVPAA